MEHIGEDIPEFSGKVTVDYKKINSEEKRDTENTAESDKYINGEYFSPVYEKPKKMKNIPKNKETNPKPTEKKIKISQYQILIILKFHLVYQCQKKRYLNL